jgi:serine/threonine-protein kinase HipA
MEVVAVRYGEHEVGAVSFDTETGQGAFEYAPSFIGTGIELSPIVMPLKPGIYSFPQLAFETYKGLPGLLADSLPDDFGNAVLNAWVASQGKSVNDISPLQRLQYTGKRGMGALEFEPATRLKSLGASQQVSEAVVLTLVAAARPA